MLVLTRRADESICIGDGIKVRILSVESDKVKIGIEAPKSVKVLREELIEEVTSANKEAVRTSKDYMNFISKNVKE